MGKKKTRLRGTFGMLDWVAKTLNKWIRVISIGNPNERTDNPSIESLQSQAIDIEQLANTNGNTDGPTTWLMSKNGSADTKWTWNAYENPNQSKLNQIAEFNQRYAYEQGNVPALGDDYLQQNQDNILYLFYEQTKTFEECFYCLKKCTKDEYDEYFENFEQQQKDRQQQIQKEAAEEEESCAKKFPFVANCLFGKQYAMLNIEHDGRTGRIYNWPAPFEMLYSVELKYVLGKIMQEISEYKAKPALDSTTSNMLQRRILLHILMSLTGTRTKKQIVDDFNRPSQPESVEYIENMCTIILQEDGIISVYLKENIQTSLTFLQDVAPKVKQYKLTAWKRKGNEVHISNLKDKIDLIKAYLKEIIKEWCTEYCTDEEWTKWVSSILQIDTKVLTDTDDSTSFIINLTDEQQVPLFKDKKARMKACERILVFGFHTGTGQQYNYSRQCYKYTEEEQENIRRMVDETVSELKRIKQNEEKSLHNSKQEGVIYRENKWGNGLAPFLQNSAAPRAVDTSRALLKQQALQERRKREADRRQKLNNNENRPNQLPPVPGALQRPEVSLAQAMEIAKAVTQLPAFPCFQSPASSVAVLLWWH
jgi:hypothetical protein